MDCMWKGIKREKRGGTHWEKKAKRDYHVRTPQKKMQQGLSKEVVATRKM